MFTIKSLGQDGPEGDQFINMTIFEADEVQEVIHQNSGNRMLRLTRFVTSAGIATTNETTILLDESHVYGPSTVYVENSQGRTVQRFTADRVVEPPSVSLK